MLRGHGESDVLPPGIGQNGFLLHYPLVSELLAANRAELALAAEADFLLVQPSSNIRTASHLQWSAFVSPLKRLGHFLIEEVYKLMKPCFKVFC